MYVKELKIVKEHILEVTLDDDSKVYLYPDFDISENDDDEVSKNKIEIIVRDYSTMPGTLILQLIGLGITSKLSSEGIALNKKYENIFPKLSVLEEYTRRLVAFYMTYMKIKK